MRNVLAGVTALVLGLTSGWVSSTAQAAPEEKLTAKIFDKDSNKQKLLFNYKHDSETKGDLRTVTNTFTDPEGKVAAVETAEFVKSGGEEKVRLYKMSQKQLGAEGSVEVKDGTANFSYTKDGKTKTSSEKVGDDFIVGPSLVAHLQKNWDKIAKGETIKTRFAVLDRTETVGFQFSKEKEADINGQKAFVIKMKPSSFLIAALVDPLHFYMTPDGKRLLELHGRTQVKRGEPGKWKDLDAVTVYEY